MIETDRLRIRPFTREDAPFILRLLNEPSFIEHIADKGVRTLEQAVAYLENGPLASYASNGHGLWAVQRKDASTPMGMCGLIKRDTFQDIDLGYAFLPEFWKQGYAHEAALACVNYGKSAMGLTRLIAIVSPTNASSIQLLTKLGFSFARMIQMDAADSGTALYELN